MISLCDRVREVCPEFPGHPETIHWSIANPAAGDADDDAHLPAVPANGRRAEDPHRVPARRAQRSNPPESQGEIMTDPSEMVSVRYMVDDVEKAVAFYTKFLDFEVLTSFAPAFADVARGNLRLLLSGPTSSAGRPMPDGTKPRTRRLEPHPPHRRRHRGRSRPAPRRGCAVPQRHPRRTRRQADPAPRPLRQRRRTLPTRRRQPDTTRHHANRVNGEPDEHRQPRRG